MGPGGGGRGGGAATDVPTHAAARAGGFSNRLARVGIVGRYVGVAFPEKPPGLHFERAVVCSIGDAVFFVQGRCLRWFLGSTAVVSGLFRLLGCCGAKL